MNILFAASEFYPLAKTGGLGDVVAALPAALQDRGHSVAAVLPLYRQVRDSGLPLKPARMDLSLPLGPRRAEGTVWEAEAPNGVRLFLVRRDEYYDRSGLYGADGRDYADNAERFLFFSKAVLEIARRLRPAPSILHLHDWQTGLVPALAHAAGDRFKKVFTIHNLGYQGSFWGLDFDMTNLPGGYFTPGGLEFYGNLNCLKAGIVYADRVTTVSPTYAQEIQTEAFGCGLDGVLRAHAAKLCGIVNGIDPEVWSPATDRHLRATYSARAPEGKKDCRKALLAECGWPEDAPEMIAGNITRLAWQKGIDIIREAWPALRALPVRFVFLGSGDPALEAWLREAQAAHPDRLRAVIGYDEGLAHRIEAGSDVFLMPSRYEPCGLNQMYSQLYGTLPIVHATGGLADTVVDCNENPRQGTGFRFAPCAPEALVGALRRALALRATLPAWERAMRRAMRQDFSWDRSAEDYERVYRAA